jgi:hypothetical protein
MRVLAASILKEKWEIIYKVGSMVICGIGLIALWHITPKPSIAPTPPTLDEIATAKKIVQLLPPQPKSDENISAALLLRKRQLF